MEQSQLAGFGAARGKVWSRKPNISVSVKAIQTWSRSPDTGKPVVRISIADRGESGWFPLPQIVECRTCTYL